MSATSLPNELWVRIFDYASNRRADIASCHLVSKAFCEFSLAFLITKVVVAKRSSSLQRLRDVLEHPIFHKSVTEVIYDASCYQQTVVSSFNVYTDVCNKFSSRVHLRQEAESRQSNLDQLFVLLRGPRIGNSPDGESTGHLDFYSEYLKYSRRWRDQEIIVARSLHLDSLRYALRRLRNLRKITYTIFATLRCQANHT